jgi:hypothetical protein
MGDEFTRDLCRWLLQVAKDAKLSDSCCRLANVLALKYMNRIKRCAWPAVPTLAKDLGVTTRAVSNQIRRLVEAGHLRVHRDPGRGHSNIYRLDLKPSDSPMGKERKGEQPFRSNDGKVGTAAASSPELPFQKTRTEVPIEPSDEPRKEPSERRPTKRKLDSSKRRNRTFIPANFTITVAHLKFAEEHGWDSNRAHLEFKQFSNHHRSEGNTFADWDAAWRTWVLRGVGYDKRRRIIRNHQPTAVDGALSYGYPEKYNE